jgi:hypothetical protein
LKNKLILIDYLNFYTFLYIVFNKYKSVQILYKHQFLNNFYSSFLKILGVNFKYLEITYSSSNSKNYDDIDIEKEYLSERNYKNNDLLSNYLYKLYFFQRIHPVVELKVFFENLNIDKVLINYGDYLSILGEKKGFYKKVHHYWLPLFSSHEDKISEFQDVYKKKMKFVIRNYFFSLIKIFSFSFVSMPQFNAKLLVAAREEKSFIFDSFYGLNKSNTDYLSIDPITSLIYSKNCKQKYSLYSINLFNFFKTIKGIYKIYSKFSIKNGMNIALCLYILEQAKTIFFLNKLIEEHGIKIIYTCYEGAPIINILNLLGYESNDVISMSASWSLGMNPQFVYQLYKGCDIFFPWGEWQKILYRKCKSPFKSMIMVGYIGDYAIESMQSSPDDEINILKEQGYQVITVFDNKPATDSFSTYQHLNNFYKGVLKILQEGSYACVIKTKKDLSYVDKELLDAIRSHGDKVLFNHEKVNLSPAFNSDFVYAWHRNTLGCMASIWGIKTILYDEGRFIIDSEVSENCTIITHLDQLVPSLNNASKDSCWVDKNSFIDPFVDGNAQHRIAEYIQLLLSSKSQSKSSMIRDTNNIYKDKYGDEMVIEKEDF